MTAINNVVGLNQNSVYEDIQTFLMKHSLRSENTKENYKRAVKKFFMFMRNKDIEYLTVEDLKFRNTDILKYQKHLTEQYANVTVNLHMSAIYTLYEHLEKNEYPVKAKVIKVDVLPEDSENYGKLSIQEAEKMAEIAKNQVKGQEKSALIRLAYTTSFRKEELLNISWDDIQYNDEQEVYLVKVIGKGNKKNIKPISQDMYDELMKVKEQAYYAKYTDGLIFHLSNTTIQSMMVQLKKEMGIAESRNVVFHSMRNVLANFIRETENDPFKIKKQLNHSDMNTSMKYIDDNVDYASMAGIQIENKIDNSIFDQLSRDELLEIIKGTTNGVNHVLKMAAKKIVERR